MNVILIIALCFLVVECICSITLVCYERNLSYKAEDYVIIIGTISFVGTLVFTFAFIILITPELYR